MIFRRSNTAEMTVPDGYAGMEPVLMGGPVSAFRAVQEGMGRPVILLIAEEAGDFDRFRSTLASLPAHPGIATVYDAGRTDTGRPYAVTACPGPSLRERIGADGPLPVAGAVAITERVADALAAAHQAGVVHGDVRPEYVLSAGDAPVLTGFGPCSLVRGGSPAMREQPGDALVHLAPEVLEGTDPGETADVYALASTLYTMLAGQPPHYRAAHEALAVLLQRKLDGATPTLPRADVSGGLMAVIRRGMAADPMGRYGSAAEFGQALRDLDADPGTESTGPAVPATDVAGTPASAAPESMGIDSPGRGPAIGASGYGPASQPVPGDEPHPVPAEPPAPAFDVETSERPAGQRVTLMAAAALAVVAVAGVIGLVGRDRPGSAATHPAATRAEPSRAAPTVTQQAAPPTKLELTSFQPTGLKAVPAPQQVVLTWRLPPGAQQDGVGIIIRRQPADGANALATLSRTQGRLPETSVAVPLKPGQQYCFLVGVLLQRPGGARTLASAGPVCAVPR